MLFAGINKPPGGAKNETTILITAKSGVTKIAKSILEHFPVAIQDMNADKKSLMLLTVQKRQPHELLNGKGKTNLFALINELNVVNSLIKAHYTLCLWLQGREKTMKWKRGRLPY